MAYSSLPNGRTSLYIHIPFCERKCPYCAFKSEIKNSEYIDCYMELMGKEIVHYSNLLGNFSPYTVYIGGGTPSVLNISQWQNLYGILSNSFKIISGTEFTVEANPNSLTEDHLKFWKNIGVNRISLGVQSFSENDLKFLGRLHSVKQAINAVELIKKYGFNLNVDFMFGLPKQTVKEWYDTLKLAVVSNPEHISLYQLTVEAGTLFADTDLDLPEGDDLYHFAQKYLPAKGYSQYEIANFSHPGKESLHNINYWDEGAYLGVGLSASGYLNGVRYRNAESFSSYKLLVEENGSAVESSESLSKEESAREASVLALRMVRGINRKKYREHYGSKAEEYVISRLGIFPKHLYVINKDRIYLTQSGMRVANIIWTEVV